MKLYQFSWGVYPRRVLVYLKEKGISTIELVEMDIVNGATRTPEFLMKSPLGTLPLLEVDNNTFVRQSNSIIEYLEEKFPTPNLMGASAEEKARARDQLSLINEAYNYGNVCTYYASPLMAQRREQKEEVAKAFHLEYTRILESLEILAGDGPYLGGDEPSVADIIFFVSEQFLRTFYKIKLPKKLVKLEAIYNNFSKRSSAKPQTYPEQIIPLAPVKWIE